MADYIATTDIRDKILATEVVSADITDSTSFFNDFVISKGLETTDIDIPVHFRIADMLIYYVQMRMSEERIGIQSNISIRSDGQPVDLYEEKYKRYKKEFEDRQDGITNEMITGDADTPEEYASGQVRIYRG